MSMNVVKTLIKFEFFYEKFLKFVHFQNSFFQNKPVFFSNFLAFITLSKVSVFIKFRSICNQHTRMETIRKTH